MREMIRAAFVIARRDFSATVLSRTFLLFLLGPFFPVLMVLDLRRRHRADRQRRTARPSRSIAPAGEFQQLEQARNRLQDTFGAIAMINLQRVEPTGQPQQAMRVLQSQKPAFAAVLEGGLAHPRLIGTVRPQSGTAKQMRLFIAEARKSSGSGAAVNLPVLLTSPSPTAPSAGGTQTAHARPGLAVPPDPAARRHAAVPADRGEIEQGDRGARGRGPDRRHLPRQAARDALRLAGRDRGVGVGRGRRDRSSSRPTALAALPVPAVGWPLFILLASSISR